MKMLPDEPLWLLQDGDQNTAHGSVMEAMEWLQKAHPTFRDWRINPEVNPGSRSITAYEPPTEGEWTVCGWIVRRA